MYRACLHPKGLARSTLNFPEWATYLLGQLHRLKLLTADPAVAELAEEVRGYANLAALGDWHSTGRWPGTAVLVPGGARRLRAVDVHHAHRVRCPARLTLAELAVELFYPADEKTAGVLAAGQAQVR